MIETFINKFKKRRKVEVIGRPAMLTLLAEESAELTKAALKLERILRGENPTPVSREEAEKNLIEEFTDVVQCAKELGLDWDINQLCWKNERWESRLNEQQKEKS